VQRLGEDPEAWIVRLMYDWGGVELLPSREASPASVWVTDDRAPGGVAGYYEKVIVPAPYQISKDGSMFRIDFTRHNYPCRIQSDRGATLAENTLRAAHAIRTILDWIEQGIVDSSTAFSAFHRNDGDSWWSILQCSPTATTDDIERAWKQRVLETHPDRGGNADAFRRVQKAFEDAVSALG